MSRSTIAWTTPATGVRPPLVIFVIVRAMAPVTGIPPKNGTTTLAIPWPISSVLVEVREPVTPSATVAESSDSIAPSTAIVNAEGRSRLIFSIVSEKLCTSGMSVDMAPNRSPIVEISSPGIMDLRKATPAVTITMASSAPGRRLKILGVRMIIARENSATQRVGMSIWSKFRR